MTEFDINVFRKRLDSLMVERKIARKPLAIQSGLGETAIRDIYNPKRQDVRVGTLVKLAEYFDLSIDDLIEEPDVRLAGRIGAGGEVIFEAVDDHDAPLVARPPGASGSMMALLVVGASMLPKYEDGDIVYVRRGNQGISKKAIGDYCAIRTTDGGTFLKILSKGSIPGRYTLRSLNAPDMENVEVEWASPVLWTKQGGEGGG